eukprot:1000775-Amphidinium_carterae.1
MQPCFRTRARKTYTMQEQQQSTKQIKITKSANSPMAIAMLGNGPGYCYGVVPCGNGCSAKH